MCDQPLSNYRFKFATSAALHFGTPQAVNQVTPIICIVFNSYTVTHLSIHFIVLLPSQETLELTPFK